jgi:hypothetical protein
VSNKQIALLAALIHFFLMALVGFIKAATVEKLGTYELINLMLASLFLSFMTSLLFDVMLFKIKEK